MSESILEQFLREEVTLLTSKRLVLALADTETECTTLNFNRFDVTIRHSDNMVFIEDITDSSSSGAQAVQMGLFASAISNRP